MSRHHCHIIETGNDSFRFKHSSATAKIRIKSREQTRHQGKAGNVVQPETDAEEAEAF